MQTGLDMLHIRAMVCRLADANGSATKWSQRKPGRLGQGEACHSVWNGSADAGQHEEAWCKYVLQITANIMSEHLSFIVTLQLYFDILLLILVTTDDRYMTLMTTTTTDAAATIAKFKLSYNCKPWIILLCMLKLVTGCLSPYGCSNKSQKWARFIFLRVQLWALDWGLA